MRAARSASLLALALALAAGCAGEPQALDACRAEIRDIEVAVTTDGRIEATSALALHAPLTGRVEYVGLQLGGTVTKGQETLRIADSGQGLAHEQATARLEAAKARLARFDAVLDPTEAADLRARRSKLAGALRDAAEVASRSLRLHARDAATRAELEADNRLVDDLQAEVEALHVRLSSPRAEMQRAELAAAVSEAAAELESASRALRDLSIRAPAAGRVYSISVEQGDFVEAGALLARLGSTDEVRARVHIDQPDLGAVRLGVAATLTADAYPDREWACTVDGLPTEVVDVGPRRVGEARCTAENSDGVLLPGLAVGVRIVIQTAEQALSLPREAIAGSGSGAHVWVLEGGLLDRREVDLGAVGPAHVEIRGGIDASDVVVIPAGAQLRRGQRARARAVRGQDGA